MVWVSVIVVVELILWLLFQLFDCVMVCYLFVFCVARVLLQCCCFVCLSWESFLETNATNNKGFAQKRRKNKTTSKGPPIVFLSFVCVTFSHRPHPPRHNNIESYCRLATEHLKHASFRLYSEAHNGRIVAPTLVTS